MAAITGNGTYGPYSWNGGAYDFMLQGAVGGATVSLQYSTDDGTNKTEEVSLSAEGHINGSIGICNFYFVVTNYVTDFYAQISEAKGAVSSSSSGLALESTSSAMATDIAELVDLSFGQDGVTVLKTGTTTKTVNFRGIQVVDAITVVTITGSNIGTDLNGVTLPVGYHPVSGTAIDVTGTAGLAYLITEA